MGLVNSYTIFEEQKVAAVEYHHEPGHSSLIFHNALLYADVAQGLSIPTHLQDTCKQKTFLPFPTTPEEVDLFAYVYKEVVFKTELIKAKYFIQE